MISLPLLKKEFKSNLIFIIIFTIVLNMYSYIIITMFDPKLGELLDGFAQNMPDLMAAFGMSNAGTTLIGFVISYFYGFIALIFPLIFIIAMGNRLIIKYIDNGSMSYILSSPNTRGKVIFTQMLFVWISLFILVSLTTILGIITCEALFPNQLNIAQYLLVNINVLAIQFAMSGVSFLIACGIKDTRKAMAVSIALPVAFYILQMIANLGGNMDKVKYLTIYTLYNPESLIANEALGIYGLVALWGIGTVCFFLSYKIFKKRDLSI